jgi:hypothetical protein
MDAVILSAAIFRAQEEIALASFNLSDEHPVSGNGDIF